MPLTSHPCNDRGIIAPVKVVALIGIDNGSQRARNAMGNESTTRVIASGDIEMYGMS